jgi:DNA polymerase-1
MTAKKSTAEKPRLFLFDAMGFIFRAFFAPMDRLRSPQGLPTKVPYLFSNMMRRLLESTDLRPDYVGVVFDRPEPTFRDALYADYKAKRPPMPEDLSIQLPFVRRYCEAMRLPILDSPGYEADDVIGALAQQAAKKGMEVYIVTSDKDMLQLVNGPVRVLRPGSGAGKPDILVDEQKVEEILGVPPSKVADVMALMGDSIDNIPGAKGIGEKGARELIQRFGSVEAALEHAAEVEGKRYREALQNQAGQVRLSKKLATIACDAPVPLALDAMKRQPPDTEALRVLYTELGFSSLLKELGPAVSTEKTDYEFFKSPAELRKFLKAQPKTQEISLWLELGSEDREEEGYGSKVTALELSAGRGTGRAALVDHSSEMLAALREWLSDPQRPKIVHDPKLTELLTASPDGSGHHLAGVHHATMLYSYLLRPTTAKHELPEVVLRHLNVTLSGAAGERADFLQRLAPILRAEVEALGLAELYEKIDLPLASILARMEREGVRIDPKGLKAISAEMEKELRALEQRIYELAGFEFNVNSPQQLAEVLFDKLNLSVARRGRAKARSTAAEVLEELALIHELPRKVMEYREISKLKSTYADVLPKLIHAGSGRLHTSLSQTGTATGRLSSSNPNLQNIPIRTKLGRQIRAAFVASPGCALLSADYSQIELRLLAHFSEDAVLVDAFRRGEDIHSRTAQEVFGVAPFAQTPDHRRAAKVINFGIIYGLSAFGLAQQLGIEQREAAKFIAAYFQNYRGVKEYLDRQVAETRQFGFTKTLFGRIRPIPEINSPQVNLRNFAERTAMNTPLQGTAADLIKLAMIEVDRRLTEENLKTKMILQVHDELLFEGPKEELDPLRRIVKPAMEQVHPLLVPLVVDIKIGPNWRDMEQDKPE